MFTEVEHHVTRLYWPHSPSEPLDAPTLITHRIRTGIIRFDHGLLHDVRIEKEAISVHPGMVSYPEELNYWLARGLAGWDLLDRRLPLSVRYADAYARAILLPALAMATAIEDGAVMCLPARHCVPSWMVRCRYRDYLALTGRTAELEQNATKVALLRDR